MPVGDISSTQGRSYCTPSLLIHLGMWCGLQFLARKWRGIKPVQGTHRPALRLLVLASVLLGLLFLHMLQYPSLRLDVQEI